MTTFAKYIKCAFPNIPSKYLLKVGNKAMKCKICEYGLETSRLVSEFFASFRIANELPLQKERFEEIKIDHVEMNSIEAGMRVKTPVSKTFLPAAN